MHPLDKILDVTVVPGYTKLGYRLRQRGWDDDALEPMDGRVALVTGASAGLGLAAATALAQLGAGVRMLARNAERADAARAEVIERTGNDDVGVVLCDLSRLADVRRCCAEFCASEPRLDVLVNNAGVLPAQRTTTSDGLELTFATNVAGPFLECEHEGLLDELLHLATADLGGAEPHVGERRAEGGLEHRVVRTDHAEARDDHPAGRVDLELGGHLPFDAGRPEDVRVPRRL
jgi:hypothetical protein